MSQPADQDRIDRLLQGLRDGDAAAPEKLLQTCGPMVFDLVRNELREQSPRFDSADVVQHVWLSFFGHLDRLKQFNNGGEMTRYLATMALNRARKMRRDHHGYQKRAVSRERSIDILPQERIDELHAGVPRPSQLAIADEAWKRLMSQSSYPQQRLLQMRLEGHSDEEIAKELKVSVRTVSRMVARIIQIAKT